MKSKILFQNKEDHYLQDLTNNFLLFLPDELFEEIHKRLDNQSTSVEINSSYYEQKAEFLIEKLTEQRMTVAENFSGRLSPKLIENTLANTRQITFELTEQCNLKCEYCAYGELYGDYLSRQNKDLSFEYVYNMLEFISKYWASERYVSVNKAIAISFYGGEPLLKMDLIQRIISLLKEKSTNSLQFIYNMTTNGVLLDKYMDFLVENDIELLISLDGDEYNNSYRVSKSGKNLFSNIVSNIMLLKERFPVYFEEKVMFASVLHNRNSVGEIIKFFREKFNKSVRISEVNPLGIKAEKKKQFNGMYQQMLESLHQAEDYENIKEDMFIKEPDTNTLMYYLHAYSGNYIKNYNAFFIDKESVRWIPTGTCVPFGKRIFLTASGVILPCERIGHQHALGFIDKNGVHLDFNEVANKYNLYYDNLHSQCSNCYRLKHCLQCIFYLDNIENNPVCKGYFDEVKFKEYLTENVGFLSKNPKLYKKIMTEVIMEE